MLQRTSLFDALVFGLGPLCFAASFLVGNHYPPWTTAYNDVLSACALALLLAAVVSRVTRLALPRTAGVVVALAAVPLLQVVAGQVFFFGDGWVATLYLLGFALAIIAGANAARLWPQRFAALVCSVWVGVALLSCLIALVQRFNVDTGNVGLFIWDVAPGRAPFANFGQPNQLATFLALALAALACLHQTRRVGSGWALAAAALFVVCMAMTQSRAGGLLLAFSLAALIGLRRRLALRSSPWAVLALVALWAGAYLLLPPLADWLGLNSGSASLASRLDAGPRTIIWAQLWEAALRRPWAGYGWNQVSVAQMAVAADFDLSRFTEHSHNLPLDLVLWSGFPLALALLGASAWWLADRARRVQSVEAGFALVFIGILGLHSMVEFPLDYLYCLLPFGLAVGIVEADAGAGERVSLPRRAVRWLPALMGAVIAVLAADYAHFEGQYRDLRLTLARVGVPLVLPADPPVQTQFTQLAALYEFPRIVARTGMPMAQREWMGRVAARHPYVPVLFRYALVQALNGDAAGAQRTFLKMKRLHSTRNVADAQAQWRELADGPYPQLKAVRLD